MAEKEKNLERDSQNLQFYTIKHFYLNTILIQGKIYNIFSYFIQFPNVCLHFYYIN